MKGHDQAAQRMQRDMMKLQRKLAASSLWARLQRSCDHHHERPHGVTNISIKPSGRSQGSGKLEDLIMAAIHKRKEKAQAACRQAVGCHRGLKIPAFSRWISCPKRSAAVEEPCAPSRDREKKRPAPRVPHHGQLPRSRACLPGPFQRQSRDQGPAPVAAAATRPCEQCPAAPCPAEQAAHLCCRKRRLHTFHVKGRILQRCLSCPGRRQISPSMGSPRTPCHQAASRTHRSPGYEVILSTGTSTEADHTALYLTRSSKRKGVKVTRMARGLPRDSDNRNIE